MTELLEHAPHELEHAPRDARVPRGELRGEEPRGEACALPGLRERERSWALPLGSSPPLDTASCMLAWKLEWIGASGCAMPSRPRIAAGTELDLRVDPWSVR
jgi:hypothetical protein